MRVITALRLLMTRTDTARLPGLHIKPSAQEGAQLDPTPRATMR